MKPKSLLITLTVLAALGAAAYEFGGAALLQTAATKPATAQPDGPAPLAVSVARASRSEFTETVLVTGSLVARDEILVAPEVEGLRVQELKVEEGARVAKGDVLATLTQDTLDAQLAQSDASLARAAAAIAKAKSEIVQYEAKLKEAKASFERAKPLNNSGYLAEATLETREAAARTADAQLVAARDSLKVAEADKAVVEAQRKELTWRRTRTEVRSPVDGVVSRRTARVGAIATAVGEPMFRLVARGEIELDGEITEERLPRVAAGQIATVEVAGIAEPLPAQVRLVSGEVDKATRLGRIRIFLGDKADLKPGMFARGLVETAKSNGIAIPASAILYGRDGATVQLVRDGKIETRRIETGLMAGGQVEIRGGVADGDLVVERAGTFLRDGDVVRPFPAPEKLSEAK